MTTLLELHGVTRRFGGLVAVDALDLAITPGTIHGVIGPNGAGKSTTFDLVSGLTRLSAGRIAFDGRDITGLAIEARVAAGICRTFQTPRLFEQMTVRDTIMTGLHRHGRMGIFRSMFSLAGKHREERALEAAARRHIDQVGLAVERGAQPVSALSYGERRLVEIARALATGPKLLMLDEVTSGLNPTETAAVGKLIGTLVADGLTVVLVEHDMPFVMGLCDRITVLNFGARIADGPPATIAADPDVVGAYLGRPRTATIPRRDARRARRALPQESIPA